MLDCEESSSVVPRPTGGDMDYQDRIVLEPGKRGGKPSIRGLRITVYDVLSYLAAGMTIEEVLTDFPALSRDDVLACLSYAAERERQTLVARM
jgi:uncharacterized protein (DUF433 family)